MVSVITPAFNAENYIEATINSVLSQSYKDWELIIVDDGSTDKTKAIVNNYVSKDSRIKLIEQKKSLGPGKARNIAIKEASGDYIAFLDSDDLWKPQKLEKQIAFMKAQNVSVCFSSYELINEQGKSLNKTVIALRELSYAKQLKCNYIGNLTGIYNAKVLGKIYMPEIKKRQDWVLWLEAIKKGGAAKGIQESLAYYRVRKNSISSNKTGLIKHNFNVYRQALGFSFFKSIKYFVLFLFEYFFVKSKQVKRTVST